MADKIGYTISFFLMGALAFYGVLFGHSLELAIIQFGFMLPHAIALAVLNWKEAGKDAVGERE